MSEPMDDEADETVTMMVGSAQASGGTDELSDDPLDLRWPAVYVPDMTSMTGWAVHRVRDRSPILAARMRRSGFRMRRS